MYIACGRLGGERGLRHEREPRDGVERRLIFRPLDGCVFNPEGGVPALALVGHVRDVQELKAEVERAHHRVFVQVADQLVAQRIRIAPLQGPRRVGGGGRGRILHDVLRAVAERDVAPVAQLLIGPNRLALLLHHGHLGPRENQLVAERQRPHRDGLVRRPDHLRVNHKRVDVVEGQGGRALQRVVLARELSARSGRAARRELDRKRQSPHVRLPIGVHVARPEFANRTVAEYEPGFA